MPKVFVRYSDEIKDMTEQEVIDKKILQEGTHIIFKGSLDEDKKIDYKTINIHLEPKEPMTTKALVTGFNQNDKDGFKMDPAKFGNTVHPFKYEQKQFQKNIETGPDVSPLQAMEEEYNKLFEYFDKAEKIELDQKIKEDLQVVLSEKKKEDTDNESSIVVQNTFKDKVADIFSKKEGEVTIKDNLVNIYKVLDMFDSIGIMKNMTAEQSIQMSPFQMLSDLNDQTNKGLKRELRSFLGALAEGELNTQINEPLAITDGNKTSGDANKIVEIENTDDNTVKARKFVNNSEIAVNEIINKANNVFNDKVNDQILVLVDYNKYNNIDILDPLSDKDLLEKKNTAIDILEKIKGLYEKMSGALKNTLPLINTGGKRRISRKRRTTKRGGLRKRRKSKRRLKKRTSKR